MIADFRASPVVVSALNASINSPFVTDPLASMISIAFRAATSLATNFEAFSSFDFISLMIESAISSGDFFILKFLHGLFGVGTTTIGKSRAVVSTLVWLMTTRIIRPIWTAVTSQNLTGRQDTIGVSGPFLVGC